MKQPLYDIVHLKSYIIRHKKTALKDGFIIHKMQELETA